MRSFQRTSESAERGGIGTRVLHRAVRARDQEIETSGVSSLLARTLVELGAGSSVQECSAGLKRLQPLIAANPELKVRAITQIQRTHGNAFVQRAVQASQPGNTASPQLQAPYYLNFTNFAPPAAPDHSRENPGPTATGANRAGYTSVRVRPRMTVAWDHLPLVNVGGMQTMPLYVQSANIFFRLDPIEVYVSSLYPVHSCPYRVTRQHEYEHVTAFAKIFHHHRATMVARVNAISLPTAASPRNVLASDVGTWQDQIMAPLAQAVRDVQGQIGREMRADRDARDAPSAYARVYAQCPAFQ